MEQKKTCKRTVKNSTFPFILSNFSSPGTTRVDLVAEKFWCWHLSVVQRQFLRVTEEVRGECEPDDLRPLIHWLTEGNERSIQTMKPRGVRQVREGLHLLQSSLPLRPPHPDRPVLIPSCMRFHNATNTLQRKVNAGKESPANKGLFWKEADACSTFKIRKSRSEVNFNESRTYHGSASWYSKFLHYNIGVVLAYSNIFIFISMHVLFLNQPQLVLNPWDIF